MTENVFRFICVAQQQSGCEPDHVSRCGLWNERWSQALGRRLTLMSNISWICVMGENSKLWNDANNKKSYGLIAFKVHCTKMYSRSSFEKMYFENASSESCHTPEGCRGISCREVLANRRYRMIISRGAGEGGVERGRPCWSIFGMKDPVTGFTQTRWGSFMSSHEREDISGHFFPAENHTNFPSILYPSEGYTWYCS